MDVQLYVYDLTRGMARQMSRQFLGIQIDAVYHTSLVFGHIEYFFGAGVQTCYPGTTHHGRPMEIIQMGKTQLPLETILEYLESLKQVYTPESYDLFAHNCNNFTHDFSMFLVGKGTPEHITSLPQRVLDTPFGQMLRPQLDAGMRSVTQAPVPTQNVPKTPSSRAPQLGPGILRSTKPVVFEKIPPLDKLMAKLGTNTTPALNDLNAFLAKREKNDRHEAPLANLPAVGDAFQRGLLALPIEARFAAVDLLRSSMVDPRVSGFFAEEKEHKTITSIAKHVLELADKCPHNLRLVTIHLACNAFSSPLFSKELFGSGESDLPPLLVQLVSNSLLDVEYLTTRVATASLAFNITQANYRIRQQERQEGLVESEQVELAASILEALQSDIGSDEALRLLLVSFGYLVANTSKEGELTDLCSALDAKATLTSLKGCRKEAEEVLKLL